MSISSALNNALTGLNAASRGAEVASNNIANAQTPGYTRRSLDLSAAVVAGVGRGVTVNGVTLTQNAVTVANRRLADAEFGFDSTMSTALTRLTDAMGTPGEETALASRAAAFVSALTSSANDPASSAGQAALAGAAKDYATTINGIAREIRETRQDADAEIAAQVTVLNTSLETIEDLNTDIKKLTVSGGDPSALIDQRKTEIDRIADIVPLRIVARQDGAVALFSQGGAILLDGSAQPLDFTPAGLISPDMTLAAGSLSGLTLSGRPVTIGDGTGSGRLDGGSLAALFEIRDVVTPEANSKLDALAQDLIQRFEDPAVDPTLAAGDPGLFTDNGSAYDALNQTGLASRIALNTAIDPAEGGDVWRLRDGINAAAQGNIASSTILGNLLDAATDVIAAPAVTGVAAPQTVASLAGELTTQMTAAQFQSDNAQAYSSALRTSLRETESGESGVDTDRELQSLLLIEQAYSANARVISVVDSLIRRLLEI
ncbi:MAG: flagellar hook-associated protein FlgK [Pseudomonadota bacterium]